MSSDTFNWYEGQWAFDLPDGFGVKAWDGNTYEGQWSKGFRHGNGTMVFSNKAVYTGSWEHDKCNGEGVLDMDGNIYSGTWHNDMLHGSAQVTYTDGGRFEGTFCNGHKEKGKFIFGKTTEKGKIPTDGIYSYEGEWFRGLAHGKGTLVMVDNTTVKGIFEYGTISGDAVSHTKGINIHGTYQNDVREGKINIQFSQKADDTLTGQLTGISLQSTSLGLFQVEPIFPLWSRRIEMELVSIQFPFFSAEKTNNLLPRKRK
eukprot:TRINITY_DN13527_c0_g3_i1.p1 TRINITY_DN13527_c0_g3~~TRINITY_DN13527_c0_g3_i1.p1  ORF type:complete len:259 (+),score=46.96 TRINITY_DN13527_c0_g3_i1:321-1097(+)